jgi:general stress protein 26
MSDLKDRIFEFARQPQLISLATSDQDGRPQLRYVVGRVDEDLVIRFSTHLDSAKVGQLETDNRVCLTLGATQLNSPLWLRVDGTAAISTEPAERERFWFGALTKYFTGVDDPRYCVVMIKPTRIEFGAEVWQADAA